MSDRRPHGELPPRVPGSGIQLVPDIPICQTDLPLDWYQTEFKPYAEEYLALPDRLPETVLPWMDGYIEPALAALGDRVMLLAHYYMGGEIVKLVERYGGHVVSRERERSALARPGGRRRSGRRATARLRRRAVECGPAVADGYDRLGDQRARDGDAAPGRRFSASSARPPTSATASTPARSWSPTVSCGSRPARR